MHLPEAIAPRTPRVRPAWLVGFGVVILAVIILSPILQYEFVLWDDDLHISTNPHFDRVTWDSLLTFWREPYARLYIPLTYTVWGGLVAFSRWLSPGPPVAGLFHGLNLLLHLASIGVVFRLGVQILKRDAEVTDYQTAGAAAAAALVFGLHPVQIEAVAWVSGLKDVLCGWWSLIAIWQYASFMQSQRRASCVAHYALASAAFLLALCAKPAAVVVPLLTAFLALYAWGQPWRGAGRALGGWFLMAALWGVLTKGQQPNVALEYVTPWWGRPIVAADAVLFYLGKLVWPLGLGPDYGRTPQRVLAHGWAYGLGMLPVVLGVSVWWARQRWRGLFLASGLFVIGLLPVLGFVPFLFQGHSTVADRYLYLAMLGPALGLGWLLRSASARRFVCIGSIVLVGFWVWRSAEQVRIWQDTVTLFTHALQITPNSAIAHGKLGTALAQEGRHTEAIAHYQAALRLRPNYVSAHNNLGRVLVTQGKLDEAMAHYREALRFEPDRADVHLNLALALTDQKCFDAALAHFTQALHSAQHRVLAHTGLGRVLAAQGKLEEAMAHYQQALQLDPEAVEAHYNLGNALVRRSQLQRAIVHYTKALQLKPDLAKAHNNLGSALDDVGRHADAIAHYRMALFLKPNLVEAHNNLGDAYLDIGRFSEAVAAFTEALRLRPDWVEGHYNLGVALTLYDQPQDAIAAYRHALRLRPEWPPASLRLAWLLATQPEPSTQHVQEALALAEEVNRQHGGGDAMALYTLAVAYRAAGREATALRTAAAALSAATDISNASLVAQIHAQFPQVTQEDTPHAHP